MIEALLNTVAAHVFLFCDVLLRGARAWGI